MKFTLQKTRRALTLAAATLCCLVALQDAAQAQAEPPPSMLVDYPHDTGLVANTGQQPVQLWASRVWGEDRR